MVDVASDRMGHIVWDHQQALWMIGYCRGISRAHNWLLMHLCDAISVVTLTVSELPCHSVTARTTRFSSVPPPPWTHSSLRTRSACPWPSQVCENPAFCLSYFWLLIDRVITEAAVSPSREIGFHTNSDVYLADRPTWH